MSDAVAIPTTCVFSVEELAAAISFIWENTPADHPPRNVYTAGNDGVQEVHVVWVDHDNDIRLGGRSMPASLRDGNGRRPMLIVANRAARRTLLRLELPEPVEPPEVWVPVTVEP